MDSSAVDGKNPRPGEEFATAAAPTQMNEPIDVVAPPPPPTYWRRLQGAGNKAPQVFQIHVGDIALRFFLTGVSLAVLGIIQHYALQGHGVQYLASVPPFGASAALLFSMPNAPAAQPRNCLFGLVTGAALGISLGHAFRHVDMGSMAAGALAAACTVSIQNTLSLPHPPALAMAMVASTFPKTGLADGEGFMFLITPVLLGAVILLAFAWLGNNIRNPHHPYPSYW